MLRCIIVEDDLIAQKSLERFCAKHKQVQLEGIFENAAAALRFFEQRQDPIDLIFLDVEMPGMSGLEFLDRLPLLPLIIFTTSNTSYAFDAFQYNALDFLKKPISMPRFDQAIAKAIDAAQKSGIRSHSPVSKSNEIYVRGDGCYIRISCDEILYFENVGDYVKVKTHTGQYVLYGSLKSVDEKLDDPRFLKVHRSFIINLNKIKNIDEHSLVIESTVIPISRAHRPELMSRLKVI